MPSQSSMMSSGTTAQVGLVTLGGFHFTKSFEQEKTWKAKEQSEEARYIHEKASRISGA